MPEDIIWLDEAPASNVQWLDENPGAELQGQETQKRSVGDALKQAFTFTPESMFNLITGLGGAVQSTATGMKSPLEVFKPEEVARGKNILGLAGAVATGGYAFPAMFTAEGAVSPLLEQYAKGEDVQLDESVKGAIDKIGNLLGNTPDAPGFAKAMLTALDQQDAPTVLGMKITTPEQKRAVSELVAAGAYLATMPSTIRKGFEYGKEGVARAKAIPQIAKERAIYGENMRVLTEQIKIKNPSLSPDSVKNLAEYLTNKRLSGKADIVMENVVAKPTILNDAVATFEKTTGMKLTVPKDIKTSAIKAEPIAPKVTPLATAKTPEAAGEGGGIAKGGEIVLSEQKTIDTFNKNKSATKDSAYYRDMEMMSVDELWKYKEFDRSHRKDSKGRKQLREDIERDGIKEALILQVSSDGSVRIGEGNNRLEIARELGIIQVPVKVLRSEGMRQQESALPMQKMKFADTAFYELRDDEKAHGVKPSLKATMSPTELGIKSKLSPKEGTQEKSPLLTELKAIQEKINEYTSAGKPVPDSLLKRQKAMTLEVEGKQGKNIPPKKLLGVPESKKYTMNEMTLLKEKLKNMARGAREGATFTRDEVKSVQDEVINMLKSSDLIAKDRAKFLDTIKNIQTQEQFEKALPKIVGRMAKLESQEARREIKTEIKKELKYTKPVKGGDRKVGKYDYESNKFFDEIRSIAKLSQSKAQTALDAIPQDNLTPLELIKAKMLSLQANGMDASLELYKQVLADIKEMKTLGAASKDDADFEKRLDRRERVVEFADAINKIRGDAKSVITKAENTYRLGFTNNYSLLNSIAGEKMAKMYDPEVMENARDTAIFNKTKEMTGKIASILDIEPAQLIKSFQDMAKEKFELVDREGIKTEVNKLQVMDIYNSLKNDLTMERYYNAFGEEQITTLVDNLTPEEKAIADYLKETVQEYREVLNDRNIEITGRDLGFVENYWPATSEREPSVFDDMRVQGETPSALKERANSTKIFPRPVDAWTKANKHIGQAEHVKELSREYEKLKRLFSDRHIKNLVEKKFGENVYRLLMSQVDNISLNKQTENLDHVTKIFGKAFSNWVVAKIANPTVFARQLVSVINYAENMPTGTWAGGFVKGLVTPRETFDFMWKNSPFLEARFNRGYSEAVKEAIDAADSMKSSLHRNWIHGLSSLVRAGDVGAIIYGGYPYVKHLMETMSQAEAFAEFERATLKSQQSGVSSGLSQFQQNKNPITRLFLAFKNTANQYLRKQADAIISYRNGDITAGQLAKTTAIYSIINPLLYMFMGAIAGKTAWDFIGNAIRGEEGKPNEEIGTDIAVQLASNPFNAIPILDDISKYVARKAMGKNAYNVLSMPLLDDLKKAVQSVSKKDVTFLDYLESLGIGAEIATGTPILTGLRVYKSIAGEKKKLKPSGRRRSRTRRY